MEMHPLLLRKHLNLNVGRSHKPVGGLGQFEGHKRCGHNNLPLEFVYTFDCGDKGYKLSRSASAHQKDDTSRCGAPSLVPRPYVLR